MMCGNNAPHYPTWILCMVSLLFTVPAYSESEQSSTPAKDPRKIIELVAGSYTSGDSQGVYRFVYNTQTQSFSQPTLLSEMKNPSFGALSNDGTLLYFCRRRPRGAGEELQAQFCKCINYPDQCTFLTGRGPLSPVPEPERAAPCGGQL